MWKKTNLQSVHISGFISPRVSILNPRYKTAAPQNNYNTKKLNVSVQNILQLTELSFFADIVCSLEANFQKQTAKISLICSHFYRPQTKFGAR